MSCLSLTRVAISWPGGYVLLRLELLHVLELAGKGSPDGEVVGLLQQVAQLRVQAVQLVLGLLTA